MVGRTWWAHLPKYIHVRFIMVYRSYMSFDDFASWLARYGENLYGYWIYPPVGERDYSIAVPLDSNGVIA